MRCSFSSSTYKIAKITDVATNIVWERPKMEKSCDVSFVTFFGDVITMALLKWRHTWFI